MDEQFSFSFEVYLFLTKTYELSRAIEKIPPV